MCVCSHLRMYVCIHIGTHAHVSIYILINAKTQTNVGLHLQTPARMRRFTKTSGNELRGRASASLGTILQAWSGVQLDTWCCHNCQTFQWCAAKMIKSTDSWWVIITLTMLNLFIYLYVGGWRMVLSECALSMFEIRSPVSNDLSSLKLFHPPYVGVSTLSWKVVKCWFSSLGG